MEHIAGNWNWHILTCTSKGIKRLLQAGERDIVVWGCDSGEDEMGKWVFDEKNEGRRERSWGQPGDLEED